MLTELWRGDFGNTYHQRNKFKPAEVRPVFDRILRGVIYETALEVGSGLGHNLAALRRQTRSLTGVEPNASARGEAKQSYPDIMFLDGDALDLPFTDGSFDLVLTCGLLIHVAPDDIQQAVAEIVRVSRGYVLAIEYNAVEEESSEYRGRRDILWRRPFGKLFQAWGGMRLLDHDDADSLLYPGCSWWLLTK